MTPEQLLEAGYKKRSWNNGAVMEYWKPVVGEFDRRLAVTFGEWKHRLFTVRLYGPGCAIECHGVLTIEQLEALYALVAGAEGENR